MQAAIASRSDYGEAYFMLGTALKQKGRSGRRRNRAALGDSSAA